MENLDIQRLAQAIVVSLMLQVVTCCCLFDIDISRKASVENYTIFGWVNILYQYLNLFLMLT